MDRISNLPGNAIDCILERLPLVDRVRTSVLSSSWRSRWTELPSLELDGRLFDCIGETPEQPSIPSVYFMIVNIILFQVKGNVREFSLYVPPNRDQLADTALSHSIKFVLSNDVRKLSVWGHYGLPFPLPSSVFSSTHLTQLYLRHCRLNLKASSGELPNLIVLRLESVVAEAEEISRLISSCPQLQKLWLGMRFRNLYRNLYISAPRLKTLCVVGFFEPFYVQNAQNLLVLDVHSYGDRYRKTGGMATFFEGMEKLERVSLNSSFCKLLALSGAPQTNLGLGRLKRLELYELGLENPDLFRFVVSMIRSSSNLKELDLSFDKYEVPQEYKSSVENNDYNFGQLIRVNVKGLTGTISQMKIVGLLLKGSPILEEMSLQIPFGLSKTSMIEIQREIECYGEASSRVKISLCK